MMRKLTLAVGFAAGYLLGAKAGTARYHQIMGQLRKVGGLPVVRETAQELHVTAATLGDRAKQTVNDRIETVLAPSDTDHRIDLTTAAVQPTPES